MRLFVFFDLPVNTANQRKAYRTFRKFLIKDGYIMLQQSVYSRLLINENAYDYALSRLRSNRPEEGLVQALKVTERQFATMQQITGEALINDEIDSIDEFVVL